MPNKKARGAIHVLAGAAVAAPHGVRHTDEAAPLGGAAGSHDFGEATVTSKGQITVPNALRQALGVAAGDRIRFVRTPDGSIRLDARKRRRIVDVARANAFRAGEEAAVDIDAAIDASITAAVRELDRRSRPKGDG